MIRRSLGFVYGVIAYIIFLASFLYAIGFLGNFVVPKTINGPGGGEGTAMALLINAALLGLFAVQHSVMARRGFKRWWTQIVPEPLERSTYVLISSLLLFLIFWQWRPMTGTIWNVEGTVGEIILWTVFGIGWAIVLLSTFLINHFDLFGLRQVYLYLQDREYEPLSFQTPGLYKYVRHPLMLGFILAFWATPHMTTGHLVFAGLVTAYVFVGIALEERDLIRRFGETYKAYRARTPMLIPWPKRESQESASVEWGSSG
jgi:protein-S-isoprenylcysteine O-methyltransferase Ste14